jgi:hypothetical protein
MNGERVGDGFMIATSGSYSGIIGGSRMLRQRATDPPSHLLTKKGEKAIQNIVFHYLLKPTTKSILVTATNVSTTSF